MIRLLLALALAAGAARAQTNVTPDEVRAIVKEAYVYGYPLVASYGAEHAWFVDRANDAFKASWNQIGSVPRVPGPEDKSRRFPDADTCTSYLGLDLRGEPIVLTLPPLERNRYVSVQLIDAYTHEFGPIGTRGSFLLAGPDWKGETPKDVTQVLRSETRFALALVHVQLFEPADLGNVVRLQSACKAQPLSAFLGVPPPPPAGEIRFPRPVAGQALRTSPEFFVVLNFVLQFCPTHDSERAMMARFAKLNIGAGLLFGSVRFEPVQKQAVADGMADALRACAEVQARVERGEIALGELHGSRASLAGNHLYRMAGAVLELHGPARQEVLELLHPAQDASQGSYLLHLAPGQLPPVDAFWSLTLYEMPGGLFFANPLQRYRVDSSMLPGMKRDPDGGWTLCVQHESPGQDKESNWLPAPKGAFQLCWRMYAPKSAALDGTWKLPALQALK